MNFLTSILTGTRTTAAAVNPAVSASVHPAVSLAAAVPRAVQSLSAEGLSVASERAGILTRAFSAESTFGRFSRFVGRTALLTGVLSGLNLSTAFVTEERLPIFSNMSLFDFGAISLLLSLGWAEAKSVARVIRSRTEPLGRRPLMLAASFLLCAIVNPSLMDTFLNGSFLYAGLRLMAMKAKRSY